MWISRKICEIPIGDETRCDCDGRRLPDGRHEKIGSHSSNVKSHPRTRLHAAPHRTCSRTQARGGWIGPWLPDWPVVGTCVSSGWTPGRLVMAKMTIVPLRSCPITVCYLRALVSSLISLVRRSCSYIKVMFSFLNLPLNFAVQKKDSHHIKMLSHVWSIKCRWNKKLIIQFCCTLRDEHFNPN
jgi:hypothetical protein